MLSRKALIIIELDDGKKVSMLVKYKPRGALAYVPITYNSTDEGKGIVVDEIIKLANGLRIVRLKDERPQ